MNLYKYIDNINYANIIKTGFIKNNEIITYTALNGYRELVPNKKEITIDTLFDIASLTKTITAITIYRAIEKGFLSLNDLVIKYEPRFINLKEVTILDLLSHRVDIWTEGHLKEEKSKDSFYNKIYTAYLKERTRTYVDTNYIILSILLENIYNKPFFKIVDEEIKKPLDIKSLTFRPDYICASSNFEYNDGKIIDYIFPGIPHDPKARVAFENNFEIGSAGIFINTNDMFKILISLIDDKELLLKKDTIDLMIKHDNIEYEIFKSLKDYGKSKNINTENINDINELFSLVNDDDYIPLKSYNYFGTRYKNPIQQENYFPEKSSDNSVKFSGYTGPTYFIDFDKKIVILIMCNYIHNNSTTTRIQRRKLNANIINLIYNDIEKER